jgi:hypothetical protein
MCPTENEAVLPPVDVATAPPLSRPHRGKIPPIQFLWVSVGVLVLLVLGVTVWPTIYRYDHMTDGKTTVPVRIHRLTGEAEFFNGQWRRAPRPPSDVPSQVLAQVTGRAGFDRDRFRGTLYNGSDWHIEEVTIRITAKNSWGGVEWVRDFRAFLSSGLSIGLSARSTSTFSIEIGEVAQSVDWQVVGAKGRPAD